MQWVDWVLPNTWEVTVNIFTVHAMETIVGKTQDNGYGHPNLPPARRAAALAAFKAAGRKYFQSDDPFVMLELYLQLKEQFGWPFFTKLFVEYRGLAGGSEAPVGDDDKIQQWVWRSSRAAERDLRGFYQAWGWPLTDDTNAKVAAFQLPAWTDPRISGEGATLDRPLTSRKVR